MKIGFTGTQTGMSENQKIALRAFLIRMGATEFHHGDCIGSDAESNVIAHELDLYVVIHPPENPYKRAFCAAQEIRDPKPYLPRNRDIVNETDHLVATPAQETETLRSGTWSTVRYARYKSKPVEVLLP